MEYVSRTLAAVQYTGGNGAEVLTLCQGITQLSGNVWSTDSDDGATLVLKETGATGLTAAWPVLAGQWVLLDLSVAITGRFSDAEYRSRYRALDAIIQAAVRANLALIAASPEIRKAVKAIIAEATTPKA